MGDEGGAARVWEESSVAAPDDVVLGRTSFGHCRQRQGDCRLDLGFVSPPEIVPILTIRTRPVPLAYVISPTWPARST
jgi:hypothetical protein